MSILLRNARVPLGTSGSFALLHVVNKKVRMDTYPAAWPLTFILWISTQRISKPHFTTKLPPWPSASFRYVAVLFHLSSFPTWIILQGEGNQYDLPSLCFHCYAGHLLVVPIRGGSLLSCLPSVAFEVLYLIVLNCTVLLSIQFLMLSSGLWFYLTLESGSPSLIYLFLFSLETDFLAYCTLNAVAFNFQMWLQVAGVLHQWLLGHWRGRTLRGGVIGKMLGEPWDRDNFAIGYEWGQVSASELGKTCFRRPEREIPWGSMDPAQMEGEVSGNSLGSVLCLRGSKRHYLSTFHFNKEHLRRWHLGSMCSLQSCYR